MAVVWHLSAIEFLDKTIVSGVLLTHLPNSKNKINNWHRNASAVIGSYFHKACINTEIRISSNNHTIRSVTDENGGFTAVFNFKIENDILIHFPENETQIKTIQSYPIFFKDPTSHLNVITDIDETVMVSFTANFFKRIFTTLFKIPKKRGVISFTKELFNSLSDKNPRYFYVSKSENNLFKIISNFIQHNDLPVGPLILTPYLNTTQLIGSKKARGFKLKAIDTLISNSKNEQFILVGDDSQGDMEIYTAIAKKYKLNVSNIYIRQTKKTISTVQKQKWEALKNTGVNSYYFKRDELYST